MRCSTSHLTTAIQIDKASILIYKDKEMALQKLCIKRTKLCGNNDQLQQSLELILEEKKENQDATK